MFIIKHKPNIGSKIRSMVFPNIDRMCSCIRCLCNNNPTFTFHSKINPHNQEFSTIEIATYLFMINNTNFFMNHTCVMTLVLFSYFVPKKFTMDESNTTLHFFDFGQPTSPSLSYKFYSTMDCSKLAICLFYKCFFINTMPWKNYTLLKGEIIALRSLPSFEK
jgi:hypothetical protein